MPDTKTILQRLLENRVDFVVVGGLAATLYGASTVTYDLDVCLDFSQENILKMMEAVRELNPRIRAQQGWILLESLSPERVSTLGNLYLQTDSGGLDLMGSLREIGSYKDVVQRSVQLEVFGSPCRVLEIQALIEIKEGIGRPKDRQVVFELRTILEKNAPKKTF